MRAAVAQWFRQCVLTNACRVFFSVSVRFFGLVEKCSFSLIQNWTNNNSHHSSSLPPLPLRGNLWLAFLWIVAWLCLTLAALKLELRKLAIN